MTAQAMQVSGDVLKIFQQFVNTLRLCPEKNLNQGNSIGDKLFEEQMRML